MMKKKALIFIDWYLPGFKAGGPIQSVSNLVDHLKEEFDFSIVTRNTDYCETIPYGNVKSNEWNHFPDGTRIYYFSEDQLTRSNIRNLIRKTEFDCVYLNGIFSLYFTLIPLFYMRKKCEKRVVIAARGMFAESALGVKKTKKKFFMRSARILKLFDNVLFHATNENEKNDIYRALGDEVPVKIAGNLSSKNSVEKKLTEREKIQDEVRLVNIARIAPEKNLLYALEILKQVKFKVDFDFYGPVYSQEYWTQCKLVLDDLPHNVNASYKGSIESSKVKDLLGNYHMMFMPTMGENFGHIILQSLSAGCPVIISDQTPWKNLADKNIGWDLNLHSTEKFAEIIDLCCRMSQADFNKMSDSAFQYAKKYSENEEIVEQNRLLFL
jgi:glycosyltransferase involved in cell wall biosynthesis